MFLTLLVLVTNAIGVAGLYALSAYISYILKPSGFTSNLLKMIPSVGLLIIDLFSTSLLEKCVEIEKWDFNSTKDIQLMWRNYIAKIFTMLVVYLLIINMTIFEKSAAQLFGITNFDFQMTLNCNYDSSINPIFISDYKTISTSETLINYSNYNNCREDLAISIILTNLLVDFVSSKVIPIFIFFVRWVWIKKIRKRENFKIHYKVVDTACELLIFYIQIFSLIPLFPYILIFAPILIYTDFKFELFRLQKLENKPSHGLSLQDKIGYFMITIFSFNMLILDALFLLYFNYGTSFESTGYLKCYQSGKYTYGAETCGPYTGYETMKSYLLEVLNENVM
jgi:hypothetical protein